MKKTIATISVTLLLAGCSGSFDTNSNPDGGFDENYQGSPEIEVDTEKTTELTTPDSAESVDLSGTESTEEAENLNETTSTGETVNQPDDEENPDSDEVENENGLETNSGADVVEKETEKEGEEEVATSETEATSFGIEATEIVDNAKKL